jgi:hypothetical protein
MAMPGLTIFLPMPSLDRMVDQCRVMVAKAPAERLPDEWKAAALDALGEVKRLNESRNVMLHDMWLPADLDAPDGHSWNRQGIGRPLEFKVTASTLSDVQDLLDALWRSFIRLGALGRALMLFTDPDRPPGVPLDRELRTVEGKFDVLPDGGYRVRED